MSLATPSSTTGSVDPVLEGSPKAPGLWFWVLALAISLPALYFALSGVDFRATGQALLETSLLPLALALVILHGSFLGRAYRWRIVLETRFPPVFWATMAGYFGNMVLPARSGEFLRSALIGRSAGVSKSYVLATALTERGLDAVVLGLLCPLVLQSMPVTPEWLVNASRTMAAVAAVGIIGILFLPLLGPYLPALFARLPGPAGIKDRGHKLADRFLLGMKSFHHPGRATWFLLCTLGLWLLDSVFCVVLAQALHLELTLAQALVLLTALSFSSALPSTPGYLGVFQYVAVTVLGPFGFSSDRALAFIILFQAANYLVVCIYGPIGIWRLRKAPEGSGRIG